MFRKHRRGQIAGGGGGTAAFVALLTLLIILWILFLPPGERDKILNNDTSSEAAAERSNLLLEEFPKTLFVEKQSEFVHTVNTVNLYVVDEDQVLKRRDAILVEGKTDSFRIAFHIDEPKNVLNAKLAYTVESHSGVLEILLNDQVIFSGEVTRVAPDPISLDNLEEDNILEFRVSEPGWQFWKVSSYQLRDVRIIASVRNQNNREASTQFSITYTPENVAKSDLRYIPNCDQASVGSLTISINDRVITSKVPECGIPDTVDIDPKILVKGTNIISFSSETGAISIDNIRVHSEVDQPTFPIYYFELNQSNFRKVENNQKNVRLTMKFAGDKTKRGTININNRKLSFNQDTNAYSKDISQYVIEDNNFIQIIPEQTLDVLEMRVRLE